MGFMVGLSLLKALGQKWVPDTWDYWITQAWPVCLKLPFPSQSKLNHT